MSQDEIRENALRRVATENPNATDFEVRKGYENIMDGIVLSVHFKNPDGKEDSNHVHFGRNDMRVYRWHSDVLNAVSGTKEKNAFFRFIELAGIGGVIAFLLVLIFSGLPCAIALLKPDDNDSILEVVKTSFTVILGYFFGSQTTRRA